MKRCQVSFQATICWAFNMPWEGAIPNGFISIYYHTYCSYTVIPALAKL